MKRGGSIWPTLIDMIMPRKLGEKCRTMSVDDFVDKVRKDHAKEAAIAARPKKLPLEQVRQMARDRWWHLSLVGRGVQTQSYAQAVLGCASCTLEAKALAVELEALNELLLEKLKTRIGC